MKLQKIIIILILFVFFKSNYGYAGTYCTMTDSTEQVSQGVFFASIYTGFYYGTKNIVPATAFEFTGGLLGYRRNLSKNVCAILIYDVTRTTSFSYSDSSGISNYFEGSKYTAFLKMGEIDWKINPYIEFNVGQLLNEQYLTVQDIFWGYRYIAFTFQEIYRFGMPADFGARIKLNLRKNLMYSFTVMNGEGPFRYQDNDGNLLFCGNIEYKPVDDVILKVYSDYIVPADNDLLPRLALSCFAGYKNGKFMIGGEYNEVFNHNYEDNLDYSGASLYSSYSVSDKTDILARCDYLFDVGTITNGQYYILGMQYSPANKFYTSANIRYNSFDDYFQFYLNFGAKF